jgi:hypothetical protein
LGFGIFTSGCAARRIALPTDPGTPLAEFAAVHAEVSSACTGVRTLTAELGLSGRAGDQSLRGRVVSGFARPGSMRLEGVAPFGPPAFILAARDDMATLLLPRDNRVLRGAAPQDILGALTGVALAPADLQAILTGCVAAAPQAASGRLHENGWATIDLADGSTLYLQRAGTAWQLRAARRSGWQIEYPAWDGRFPSMVRLRSDAQNLPVDVAASVSQIETNIDIQPVAFEVAVPPDARELTLRELQIAGPLRGAD